MSPSSGDIINYWILFDQVGFFGSLCVAGLQKDGRAAGAHPGAHGREAVPVRHLRGAVRAIGAPQAPPARPHRRAALRVPPLPKDLLATGGSLDRVASAIPTLSLAADDAIVSLQPISDRC